MTTWPATLPPPLIGTMNETPPDNTIRSNVDKGPAMLRRRTTANVRPLSFGMVLTNDQVAILDDFYNDDTYSGSERFDFTHPRTLAAVEARFTAPPSYSNIDGDNWNVSVSLEVLP